MLQLCYISTARPSVDAAAIEAILRTARTHNAAAQVTGLLLYNGRRFLQVLEGPDHAVRSIYDRIATDPRHFAMVQLSERTIDAREFAAWDMAYQTLALDHGALCDRIEQLTQGASASVRALFTSYAAI
ncbi:MAG: hypothetical protein A4S16_06335 [Proteobacteria bacterium SG_bin6]|nr:MAG: hypothetical protein A4S16_06335 [Proteobacteria bacterium SG_bin6]